MDFSTFLRPELAFLIPVLYILGMFFKNSASVKDKKGGQGQISQYGIARLDLGRVVLNRKNIYGFSGSLLPI